MPYLDVRKACLLLFLTFGFCLQVFSQSNSGLNWYFGNNANSFRFIRPNYTPQLVNVPNALGTGMSAVATNPVTGSLLFYTDGRFVYDANDGLMPNGNGLMVDVAFNQGVAICANPMNADPNTDINQYFIFTNDGTIRQTTVDTDLPGNASFPAPSLGNVSTKNVVGNLPATPRSQGMIVISNATKDGFWLISHRAGTSEYDVNEIDNAGNIGTSTTATFPQAPTNVANFSYNKATNQIAVSGLTLEEVVILDIDPATGVLTFDNTKIIPGTDVSTLPGENIYDTEWSNDGRYLYISGNFGAAQDSLMQVDLTVSPFTLTSLNTGVMTRSYGLQIAPDSAIYHLYQMSAGQFRLGRINNPDTVAGQTLYDPSPLGTANFLGRQFPAFLPEFDPSLEVDFTFSGSCANAPTLFFPDITPGADSVRWNFGDGNGSTQLSPFNTYAAEGTYDVRLVAYANGDSADVVKQVPIQAFDLQISGIPQADTVCAEDFPVEYTAMASGTGAGSEVYKWSSNDDTGPTTTIDSAGNYYVVATLGGCETYAPLQVVEYGAIEQRAFIWYFGEHAGIDFNPITDVDNPGPPRPIPYGDPDDFNGGNEMIAPEGCAIYCDQNGQPVFYSDGSNFYDNEGTEFATGVGGDPGATQSVFITQFPNDATLFYVFMTKEIYDLSGNNEYMLSYAVYDLKKRNGLGDLLRDNANQVIVTDLYNGNTERLTGNNSWIIVHEYGNNNFRAYPITGNGIGTPVISNVGSIHPGSSEVAGRGYMKLADGGKLAVALSISETENYVELFDFVDSTGAVTNPILLDFGAEQGQVYGIEFSQDERKVFASLRNTNAGVGKLFRWEIDTTTVPLTVTDPQYIKDSREEIASESGVDFGALQIGPDGQIYVAKDGEPTLATIGNPNGIPNDDDAGFTLDGFGLGPNLINPGPTLSTLGLPNFADQFSSSPPMVSINTPSGCSGETFSFSVNNPSSLEQYRWNIMNGDGQVVASDIGNSVSFTFSTPGIYTARVDIIQECSEINNPSYDPPDPLMQQFSVNNLPVFTIDQVQDVTGSCGAANGSFQVNNIEAGSFVFSITGPVPTTADTVASPFTYTATGLSAGGYNVTFTNVATGCSTTLSQSIDDPAPWTMSTSTTPADCNGQNGTVTFQLSNNPASPVYPVSFILRNQNSGTVANSGNYDNSDGLQSFDITPVMAGTYTLEVTEDGINGCTKTETDIIVGTPPLVDLDLPLEVIKCDATEARIGFTTNANAIAVIDGPGQASFVGDTLIVTVPGTYTIATQDNTGTLCNVQQQLEVIFNQSTPNPFASRYTICPDDPLPENAQAFLYPGSGFVDVKYFDEDGSQITANTPGFDIRGDTLVVFVLETVSAQLTNPFGCITNAEIEIVQDCKGRINAPNAFSPNGDGNNDGFILFPVLVSDQDFQIFIFNRWGEMIFQSDDLNFMKTTGWNGGYDNDPNRPVQGGTYAYKINFRSEFEPEKGLQERRGGVTVIR